MRLHALIFGAVAGTPLLGLAYDPKVAQFMQELGQEDAYLSYSVESVLSMSEELRGVLSGSSERRAAIEAASARLRKRALRSAEVALECLEGRA
jgi:polysaccharide pyruvyl transferase WcaK-like protein